ncbi:hypothetical protein [Mycolicibacterium madagascariense]|nr:hypothetical protein [Mycolicibacterium madagascariense]
MSLRILTATPFVAAACAAAAIALGPVASAEPDQCSSTGLSTQCEQPGNSSLFASPGGTGEQGGGMTGGAGNANDQNGSYGPSGDQPPVGGHGGSR